MAKTRKPQRTKARKAAKKRRVRPTVEELLQQQKQKAESTALSFGLFDPMLPDNTVWRINLGSAESDGLGGKTWTPRDFQPSEIKTMKTLAMWMNKALTGARSRYQVGIYPARLILESFSVPLTVTNDDGEDDDDDAGEEWNDGGAA